MFVVILWENMVIMKNLKKYAVITVITLILGFLTISVSHTPNRKSHSSGLDRPIRIEKWMTVPFMDSIEEPLEVEDWMTKPFNTI